MEICLTIPSRSALTTIIADFSSIKDPRSEIISLWMENLWASSASLAASSALTFADSASILLSLSASIAAFFSRSARSIGSQCAHALLSLRQVSIQARGALLPPALPSPCVRHQPQLFRARLLQFCGHELQFALRSFFPKPGKLSLFCFVLQAFFHALPKFRQNLVLYLRCLCGEFAMSRLWRLTLRF